MTRRSLVRRALLILVMQPIGLIACMFRRPPGNPFSAIEVSETAPLSAAEVEDLVAFGEVLLEGRPLSPTERGYLVGHIRSGSNRSPDHLSLYRSAATALDRAAGRRFANLEMRERLNIVARHSLGESIARPGQDLDAMPADMWALRTRAVPDLIRGYYGSPAGWAAVGYDSFPGRCGGLVRYTGPES
jgi:hypothetical protein